MSFVTLREQGPNAAADYVELALDQMDATEGMEAECKAARVVLYDKRWSGPSVARAFNDLGFTDITSKRVNEHRRKMRERGYML